MPTENVSLVNFTMIHAGQFRDKDLGIAMDGIIDALWCQSDAEMADNNGTWYYPPGADSVVPNMGTPLWMVHFTGQVGLYRNTGISGREGLFRCVITDADMTEHTFYVGIYRTDDTFYNYSKWKTIQAL